MTTTHAKSLLLWFAALTTLGLFGLLGCHSARTPQTGQADARPLRWSLGYDPDTLDPAKVDDQASETLRYLTGGVLIRINRQTNQPEPALASHWNVSEDGRTVTITLRPALRFSDGSALSSADVAATLRRNLDPATAAPVAQEFLEPGRVRITAPDSSTVVLALPQRLVELPHILDEIAIEPGTLAQHEARVTAGPYRLVSYQRGQQIELERNPFYWRHSSTGAPMPYISTVRLALAGSAEQEQAHFGRGDYQFINGIAPEYFNLLARSGAGLAQTAHDLGPSLNTEQLWFNQAADAPLPAYEQAWFRTTEFRQAVSRAIHRADLARLAYAGHATPAYGFISPANRAWYDPAGDAPHEDQQAAEQLLQKAGFRRSGPGAPLTDAGGHPVRFSLVTNAGNPARARMAALVQQDLSALGMDVRVSTLDFPALIEKLMHTHSYEACLLGLSNVDPDPNAEMNVWLSSSPNHQWNPGEKTPATPWEAEIDQAMRAQASAASLSDRLRAVHQVSRIVAEQQPFIYLVYPNALYAVSPDLAGVELSVLPPGSVWNIDELRWKDGAGAGKQ